MGGAPPLPHNFAPEGAKNRKFLRFLGPRRQGAAGGPGGRRPGPETPGGPREGPGGAPRGAVGGPRNPGSQSPPGAARSHPERQRTQRRRREKYPAEPTWWIAYGSWPATAGEIRRVDQTHPERHESGASHHLSQRSGYHIARRVASDSGWGWRGDPPTIRGDGQRASGAEHEAGGGDGEFEGTRPPQLPGG